MIPTNPQTSFQQNVRDDLATWSGRWRLLTEAQRLAWSSLGAQIVRTDTLGESYTLTGLQAYISVNRNLHTLGSASVDDAPLYSPPPNMGTFSLNAINGAITDELKVNFTPDPLAAGNKLLMFASPGVSAGLNFLPASRYKLIAIGADATDSPFEVVTNWVTRFGTFPAVGAKIFVRGIVVKSNGLATVVAQASDVITAI